MKQDNNKKRFTVGTVVTVVAILAIISIAKDGLDLITQYILPSPTTAPMFAANPTLPAASTDTIAAPTDSPALPTGTAAAPTDSPALPTDTAVAPTDPPPVPTNTPTAPTVTSAPPPETPTAVPQPTEAPVNTTSEVSEVDAYRTALGSPANTGVYVQAGDNVDITYQYGEWWIGQGTQCNGYGNAQTPTGAAGYLGRDGDRAEALIGCDNANKCRPLSGAPWGSLLGSIGENGPLFHIGNQLIFVAQDSGIIHLRINYFNHNAVTGCPYGDGGNITVRIDVTPP